MIILKYRVRELPRLTGDSSCSVLCTVYDNASTSIKEAMDQAKQNFTRRLSGLELVMAERINPDEAGLEEDDDNA